MCCFIPQKVASKGCLCWIFLSMIFSAALVGMMVHLEILGEGSFPTKKYFLSFKLLYSGNTISFLGSILCTLIILREIRHRGFALGCGFILLLTFCVSLYCIYNLTERPTVPQISEYTRMYFKSNKESPPFLRSVQKQARFDVRDRKLGCCGGLSFHDYANVTKRWNLAKNNYEFDAPDDCCIQIMKDCGKNLLYYLHNFEYETIDEVIMTKQNPKVKKSFEESVQITIYRRIKYEGEIIANMSETINKLRNSNKNGVHIMLGRNSMTMTSKNGTGTSSPFKKLANMNANVTTASNKVANKNATLTESYHVLNAKIKEMTWALERLSDYRKFHRLGVKINVLGCGQIFTELRNHPKLPDNMREQAKKIDDFLKLILILTVSKGFLDVIAIFVFAVYYFRYNMYVIGQPVTGHSHALDRQTSYLPKDFNQLCGEIA